MERVRLKVEGMSCGHCVAAVKKALCDIPGVREARVCLEPPEAAVEFDSKRVTPQELVKVVAEEGFSSSVMT